MGKIKFNEKSKQRKIEAKLDNKVKKEEKNANKINKMLNKKERNKKDREKLKNTRNFEKKNANLETEGEDDQLTLDIIKELGGTEEDLKLCEEIEGKVEAEALDVKGQQELKKLISSLNLQQFSASQFLPDEEFEKKEQEEQEKQTKEENKKAENKTKETKNEKSEDDEVKLEIDADAPNRPEFHFIKDFTTRKNPIINKEEKWYTNLPDVESKSTGKAGKLSYWLPKLRKYAEKVMEQELENFSSSERSGANKSDAVWLQTVLKSGTLTDKLSAYVVQVQNSPVHHFAVLETMLGLISLKSRRPCLLALDTVSQLLLSDLLIPDRKLGTFDHKPFHLLQELSAGDKETRDRILVSWLYEDKLRDFYIRFIQAMDIVGKDTIDNTRVKVIGCTQRLLVGNPEQEQMLLEKLVNRLGDPTRAVAAKAMHHLSLVLEEHPGMKQIMVKEVERLLYRPNISQKAQYYGICFLSQLLLERHGSDLASALLNIYFSFFTISIKKGEIDTKLMSALLTGVNRAFPYSALNPAQLDTHIETMHKLVHMVSFNISVQALTLLFQILDARDSVNDRYYTALYRKLLDPAFGQSSKQVLLLNLVYNSVRKDESLPRVHGFIKRLMQMCEFMSAHTTAGILFIISRIIKDRTDLVSLRGVLESGATDGGGGKGSTDLSRFDDDSDGEEHYEDVKEEEDDHNTAEEETVKDEDDKSELESDDKKVAKSSWNFSAIKLKGHDKKVGYDPLCRNPLYAGADKSPFWELDCLCAHFHPTVRLFARHLSENTPIKYGGDPLNDFTVAKFLDRFVFRNPKKDPAKNKPSTIHGKRNIYRPTGIKALAPDSKEFLVRGEETVPGDELYLYKYFQAKSVRNAGKEKDNDNDSVTSEEFNAFLDKMSGDRSKDFDDEDAIDFAGGVGDDNDESEGDNDGGDSDNDDNDEEEEGSEPEGLDGEDDNDDFKDLSDDEAAGDVNYLDDDDDEDMNEEDLEFSDNEESEEEPTKKGKSSTKKPAFQPSKKIKKDKIRFDPNDLSSLLADADEFSHLLQENQDSGTSGSMRNKDKASAKQLAWEERRNNFMTDKPWTKGGPKGKGPKGPSKGGFKGKRPTGGKGGSNKPAKKKMKR